MLEFSYTRLTGASLSCWGASFILSGPVMAVGIRTAPTLPGVWDGNKQRISGEGMCCRRGHDHGRDGAGRCIKINAWSFCQRSTDDDADSASGTTILVYSDSDATATDTDAGDYQPNPDKSKTAQVNGGTSGESS
ncbi:hypothetical protein J8273_7078 [Carpediemonas membranifera]|uniref:Uncharacterized protein n=1 Tax=Carpediemonas membranifera TaxID=201153 RepID=A0A8J6DXR1_9EUKA|nr:hypothetical protein J8273_7078 [Carpediemonas membranifera]|eukprot:KAG9390819.1 hypothetical protein J8273_7078 [Carpediemonas membranifera]